MILLSCVITWHFKRGGSDWQESRGGQGHERGGYDRQDRFNGPPRDQYGGGQPRGDFVRRESYIPPDVADGYVLLYR